MCGGGGVWWWCSAAGNFEGVKLLLERGADVGKVSGVKKTAKDVAKTKQIAELLEAAC